MAKTRVGYQRYRMLGVELPVYCVNIPKLTGIRNWQECGRSKLGNTFLI
jgi:hypothetical protein